MEILTKYCLLKVLLLLLFFLIITIFVHNIEGSSHETALPETTRERKNYKEKYHLTSAPNFTFTRFFFYRVARHSGQTELVIISNFLPPFSAERRAFSVFENAWKVVNSENIIFGCEFIYTINVHRGITFLIQWTCLTRTTLCMNSAAEVNRSSTLYNNWNTCGCINLKSDAHPLESFSSLSSLSISYWMWVIWQTETWDIS